MSSIPRKDTLYYRLTKRGAFIDGFEGDNLEHPLSIPWLDLSLIQKGREFVEKNFILVFLNLLMANWIGFAGKQIAAVFFRNFYPTNTCGPRFLSTWHSELSWFLSDGFDKNSKFMQEIRRVRKLHKLHGRPKERPIIPLEKLRGTYPPEYTQIIETIRHDLKHVDTSDFPAHIISWEPSMYFTQFDVALVQLGGIIGFLVHPEKIGVATYEENEGLQGYFHIWAVIGRLLGLRDELNPALHPFKEEYIEMGNKIGLSALKHSDETVIFAYDLLIQQISKIIPFFVTLKGVLYAIYHMENISGDALWKTMTLRDKTSFSLSQIGLFLLRLSWFKRIANIFAKTFLNIYFKMYLKSYRNKS